MTIRSNPSTTSSSAMQSYDKMPSFVLHPRPSKRGCLPIFPLLDTSFTSTVSRSLRPPRMDGPSTMAIESDLPECLLLPRLQETPSRPSPLAMIAKDLPSHVLPSLKRKRTSENDIPEANLSVILDNETVNYLTDDDDEGTSCFETPKRRATEEAYLTSPPMIHRVTPCYYDFGESWRGNLNDLPLLPSTSTY